MNDDNPYRSPESAVESPSIEIAKIFDRLQGGLRRALWIPVGVRFISNSFGYNCENACMIAICVIGISGLSCLLLSWVFRR